MKQLYGCVGIIVTTILLLLFQVLLNAFVITKLWEWFVHPLSPEMLIHTLSAPHSLGISLFASFIIKDPGLKQNRLSGAEAIAATTVFSIVTLLIAWAVHLFM